MCKYIKKIIKASEEVSGEFGVKVLKVTYGRNHNKLVMVNKRGFTQYVVFASSPSDIRAQKNHLSNVRRVAREICDV